MTRMRLVNGPDLKTLENRFVKAKETRNLYDSSVPFLSAKSSMGVSLLVNTLEKDNKRKDRFKIDGIVFFGAGGSYGFDGYYIPKSQEAVIDV